jgi:hypothetical protein
VKLTVLLYTVSRLRMRAAITIFPHTSSCHGELSRGHIFIHMTLNELWSRMNPKAGLGMIQEEMIKGCLR